MKIRTSDLHFIRCGSQPINLTLEDHFHFLLHASSKQKQLENPFIYVC
jgi:hypothetical protein